MIKIAEGRERGRRRKGEGTGAASSAIFWHHVRWALCRRCQKLIPANLSPSDPFFLSLSLAFHPFSAALLGGSTPASPPSSWYVLLFSAQQLRQLFFYTIRFLFCIFVWTCVWGGGGCLIAFFLPLSTLLDIEDSFFFLISTAIFIHLFNRNLDSDSTSQFWFLNDSFNKSFNTFEEITLSKIIWSYLIIYEGLKNIAACMCVYIYTLIYTHV